MPVAAQEKNIVKELLELGKAKGKLRSTMPLRTWIST